MLINNNIKAQTTVEYAIVLALILTATTALTLFVRRAMQGQVKDAKDMMMDIVRTEYEGELRDEYEPYYIAVEQVTTVNSHDVTRMSDSGFDTYRKEYGDNVRRESTSTTMPPGGVPPE